MRFVHVGKENCGMSASRTQLSLCPLRLLPLHTTPNTAAAAAAAAAASLPHLLASLPQVYSSAAHFLLSHESPATARLALGCADYRAACP